MLENISKIDVYLGIAITSLFVGIGSSIGQTISKLWVEPAIRKVHKGIRRKKWD